VILVVSTVSADLLIINLFVKFGVIIPLTVVPSQNAHPMGTEVPLHIIIPPTGIVPFPVNEVAFTVPGISTRPADDIVRRSSELYLSKILNRGVELVCGKMPQSAPLMLGAVIRISADKFETCKLHDGEAVPIPILPDCKIVNLGAEPVLIAKSLAVGVSIVLTFIVLILVL
jgi:hypothetical protein